MVSICEHTEGKNEYLIFEKLYLNREDEYYESISLIIDFEKMKYLTVRILSFVASDIRMGKYIPSPVVKTDR